MTKYWMIWENREMIQALVSSTRNSSSSTCDPASSNMTTNHSWQSLSIAMSIVCLRSSPNPYGLTAVSQLCTCSLTTQRSSCVRNTKHNESSCDSCWPQSVTSWNSHWTPSATPLMHLVDISVCELMMRTLSAWRSASSCCCHWSVTSLTLPKLIKEHSSLKHNDSICMMHWMKWSSCSHCRHNASDWTLMWSLRWMKLRLSQTRNDWNKCWSTWCQMQWSSHSVVTFIL